MKREQKLTRLTVRKWSNLVADKHTFPCAAIKVTVLLFVNAHCLVFKYFNSTQGQSQTFMFLNHLWNVCAVCPLFIVCLCVRMCVLCVCVCACVCVCLCTYVCLCVCVHCVCICACMCVCACVCVCTCVSVFIVSVCAYVCTCVHVCVCTSVFTVCMHVCMLFMHVSVCACVCLCVHVCLCCVCLCPCTCVCACLCACAPAHLAVLEHQEPQLHGPTPRLKGEARSHVHVRLCVSAGVGCSLQTGCRPRKATGKADAAGDRPGLGVV